VSSAAATIAPRRSAALIHKERGRRDSTEPFIIQPLSLVPACDPIAMGDRIMAENIDG